MIRLTAAATTILLAILLGSCASVDPLIAPEPSVVDVRFQKATAFETRAVFTVRLANENPVPLAVEGGSFVVSLNGVSFGKGMTGDTVALPRLGTATLEVPVHVNHVKLLLKAPALLEATRLSYEVESTLYVNDGKRTRRLRRESAGEFDLAASEQQALRALAAPAGAASPR